MQLPIDGQLTNTSVPKIPTGSMGCRWMFDQRGLAFHITWYFLHRTITTNYFFYREHHYLG
jgi:hypothetical protein